jgi:hypothetical protein
MSASTSWVPPAGPADGWNNHQIAVRARTVFFWSRGILVGSCIAAAGLSSTQSLGVFGCGLGCVTAMALAVGAIVTGAAQLFPFRTNVAGVPGPFVRMGNSCRGGRG